MIENRTAPIRLLIADDHLIIRQGIRSLFMDREDILIIGEAENGQDAVQKFQELKPDVILMDLVMPKMDGIEAIRIIKQQFPCAKILVLTSFDDDDRVFPAIKAGAQGYLLKDTSPQDLIQGIKDVFQGQSSLDPSIALKVIQELSQTGSSLPAKELLTDRETEVLSLLSQGYSNPEISQMMFISNRTVGTHVSNILRKLHLNNRTQAALHALKTKKN
jgi:NarL family two-component system response regulator LiaR